MPSFEEILHSLSVIREVCRNQECCQGCPLRGRANLERSEWKCGLRTRPDSWTLVDTSINWNAFSGQVK